MKRNRKNTLRSFLFACLGLTVTTIMVAGVSAMITPPSQLGRPDALDIQETKCRIMYRIPDNDGGEPVKNYYIEYKNQWNLSWKFRGTSKGLEYQFKNMREGSMAQFRVSASNSAGIGNPSYGSNFIKFRGPFSE